MSFHNTVYGTKYRRSDICNFELQPLWGCSLNEVVQRINDFYNSTYHENLQPVLGAVESLEKLRQNNTLVLITSRPEHVRDVTEKLLQRYFLNFFNEIHFLGHYHGIQTRRQTKGEVCKNIGVEIFIDDSLEHAKTVCQEKIPALLFDTPWNQGTLPENITRVFSWDEILEKLL